MSIDSFNIANFWSEKGSLGGSYGIDPTILLRLHSIMSGQDIFTLAERYNYNGTVLNNKLIYLTLSEDFINLLISINENNFYDISQKLCTSPEALLHDWDIPTAKHFIYRLLNKVTLMDDTFLLYLPTNKEESNDV